MMYWMSTANTSYQLGHPDGNITLFTRTIRAWSANQPVIHEMRNGVLMVLTPAVLQQVSIMDKTITYTIN